MTIQQFKENLKYIKTSKYVVLRSGNVNGLQVARVERKFFESHFSTPENFNELMEFLFNRYFEC